MLTDFFSFMNYCTPMIFAALAVAVALKAGLFNIGISGQMLTFDVTGILADTDPWKGGMMASYGYTLPITKRLNLDFEAGLGFIVGDVHKYDVVENGPDTWLRIHKSTDKAAFVPKLGVTLQYLIGTNNYNTRRK